MKKQTRLIVALTSLIASLNDRAWEVMSLQGPTFSPSTTQEEAEVVWKKFRDAQDQLWADLQKELDEIRGSVFYFDAYLSALTDAEGCWMGAAHLNWEPIKASRTGKPNHKWVTLLPGHRETFCEGYVPTVGTVSGIKHIVELVQPAGKNSYLAVLAPKCHWKHVAEFTCNDRKYEEYVVVSEYRHTFMFWIDYQNAPILEEGYHICRKANGKKVAYKVELVEEADGNLFYYITTKTWAERRTVQRRVFGWK